MKRLVVIVDDEYGLADVMAKLLADDGYETSVANNGRAGMSLMMAQPPDLVFLDMMMPLLDGAAVLREMRQSPSLADVPVVLMTALSGSIPLDQPPKHQAVLLKPFTQDEMFTVLRSLI